MTAQPLGRELLRLSILCFSALILVYLPLIEDPFVRHDDFAALLGTHEAAWQKALDEGRWLNYWWQFRPVFLSASSNFLLYLAGQSIFAAATALAMLDRETGGWYKGFLALFVALSIPASLISYWFNTMLPGAWVIAFFAMAVVFLSHRAALMLLVVAVPLSFMAYTTYPFLLLSLVLLSRKAPKTWQSVLLTLIVFMCALALGVLAVYSLNYIHHGVFGIPVASWREPTEVQSWTDLLSNLDKQKEYLQTMFLQMGGGVTALGWCIPVLYLVFWGGLFFLNRFSAITVLVAVAVGLAPLLEKALMSGLQVPLRTLGWVWLLLGYCLVSVVVELSRTRGKIFQATRVVSVCFLVFQFLALATFPYGFLPLWQVTTKEMAEAVPANTQTVYVYGDYKKIPGARQAAIQDVRGLRARLEYLTGATVVVCDDAPEDCAELAPPFDPEDRVADAVVAADGAEVFILLSIAKEAL